MPTSDGINDDDWDQIHHDAAAIVEASSGGLDTSLLTSRLMDQLSYLEEKYGRLPSLLATRADFIEDETLTRALLKEAYITALELEDDINAKEICLSIFESYRELDSDHPLGSFWAELLRSHLEDSPDESISSQLLDYGY